MSRPASIVVVLVGSVSLTLACSGSPGSGSQPGASSTSPTEDAGGGAPANVDDGGVTLSNGGGDGGGSSSPSAPSGDAASPGYDSGTRADGAAPSAPTIDYAPYFPTWVWGGSGYAFTGLADLQAKAGVNEVTIAFVLSNGGCNTTQDIEQNASDVKAFIAAGGHLKASFGGADGAYVESQCTTAATWAGAIEDFVDATGITDLDFDIEQDAVLTDAVNEMRGQALKLAQTAKGIQVAFTLAANPSPNGGLTSQGMSVVSHALSAGVTVSHVNLMTMDYGDSYGGQALAPVVIGSLNDGNAQMLTLVPGLTAAQAWRMIGVIPMIGKNDDSEVFSLDDAKTLETFATTNMLGLVSFWSIDRDQVCPSGADYNSCSTVDPTNFAFNAVLKGVTE
jgi:Glycosyl hydrolases family 18